MRAEEALELIAGLPYQEVADSPTVKYYTDWRVFESNLGVRDAVYSESLPNPLRRFKPDVELRGRLDTYIPTVSSGGVRISPLRKADVKPPVVGRKLDALHELRWFGGVELSVDPGVKLPHPLGVLSVSGKGYVGHHIRVSVGEGAEATLIVLDYAGVEKGLKTSFIEGDVGRGGKLNLVSLTIHKWGVPSYLRRRFRVQEGGALTVRSVAGGGIMTREEYDVSLSRESSLEFLGSAVTKYGCRLDLITNVRHEGPSSSSLVRVRGGVKEFSTLVHRGVSSVERGAEGSDTYIESRITVLGKGGKGYSVPML
ncbi:MAG: SufD family Fe-S cluster assembly protein, partial [Desulfurococcales archaeon]|nr:SufD family Fe-S cluster assembly protein [Desulfurococcales archaeon]